MADATSQIQSKIRAVVNDDATTDQIRAVVDAWIVSPDGKSYIDAKIREQIERYFDPDRARYDQNCGFARLRNELAIAVTNAIQAPIGALEAALAVVTTGVVSEVARRLLDVTEKR